MFSWQESSSSAAEEPSAAPGLPRLPEPAAPSTHRVEITSSSAASENEEPELLQHTVQGELRPAQVGLSLRPEEGQPRSFSSSSDASQSE